MLFKPGKDILDQHREMIFSLLKQNDALRLALGKLSRALLGWLETERVDEWQARRERLKEILKAIAADAGE